MTARLTAEERAKRAAERKAERVAAGKSQHRTAFADIGDNAAIAASGAAADVINTPARTISSESTRNDARTIFGLMAFATAFSLVGNEIRASKQSPNQIVTEPVRIVAGGTVATVVLVLVSHAGDPGRQFAVGLATVAFLSSVLVYGGPVWNALSNVFGGTKPTTPTKPTADTTPTPTPQKVGK